MRFFEWMRRNSEKYLLEAAQADLARRYLGRPGPVGRPGLERLFWKGLFVPIYRRLPWRLRHAVILSMPGSHRRAWKPQNPQRRLKDRWGGFGRGEADSPPNQPPVRARASGDPLRPKEPESD